VIFLVKKKGEQYTCDDCGLVVLVESPCECGDECEIMCCEKPMKQVKAKPAASKAPVKASEKATKKTKK
jgi:hypothetical protein